MKQLPMIHFCPLQWVRLKVMERYPGYTPRDYPTGVSDFVNTFPP